MNKLVASSLGRVLTAPKRVLNAFRQVPQWIPPTRHNRAPSRICLVFVSGAGGLWLYVGQWREVIAQGVATPASAPSPTPMAVADALKVYESVATTAIQQSVQTVETVKWVIIVLAGLATTAIAYLYREASNAAKLASVAQAAAQDARTAALRAGDQLDDLMKQHLATSEQYYALRAQLDTLDSALAAGDRGEVSQRTVVSLQQWHSWKKWTRAGNPLGFQELLEWSKGKGLTPDLQRIVQSEIHRLEGNWRAGAPDVHADGRLEQLRLLLAARMDDESGTVSSRNGEPAKTAF